MKDILFVLGVLIPIVIATIVNYAINKRYSKKEIIGKLNVVTDEDGCYLMLDVKSHDILNNLKDGDSVRMTVKRIDTVKYINADSRNNQSL